MKNNYLAPQVSYEHYLRGCNATELKEEQMQILNKSFIDDKDYNYLVIINQQYYQLTGKHLVDDV